MNENIGMLVKELHALTIGQLQTRYAEVYGEPTLGKNKRHLVKRIVWRVQALKQGDLSERARRRARELAQDTDIRLTEPDTPVPDPRGRTFESVFVPSRTATTVPLPGSVIRREYKDRVLLVKVLPRGFEFEGQVYKSLSAVARQVTGSHWNGPAFFGLASPKAKSTPKEAAR